MGWICVTDACEGHIDVATGVWDGAGIAFFSISDEIAYIHSSFFSFLMSFSPTVYLYMFIIFVVTLIVSILVNVQRVMKQSANV